MPETLHFIVTGEWVTQMARDLFWAENKPYSEVEGFLLNCMCGTTLSQSTLKSYAKQVILGKAKFIGRTDDGTYCLTEDNADIAQIYKGFARLLDIPFVERALEAYIRNEKIQEENNLAEHLNQTDYGWLAPNGTFFPVEWAGHTAWALNYAEEHFIKEFSEYRQEGHKHSATDFLGAGDFLVYKMGWILLHNPYQGAAFETRDKSRRRTKAQTEFLFDYYIQRGMNQKAYALYQEGE